MLMLDELLNIFCAETEHCTFFIVSINNIINEYVFILLCKVKVNRICCADVIMKAFWSLKADFSS